jgi:trk/ktr system potassium uptake protein
VDDPWVCLPVAAAVIAGGLGTPVWLDLRRRGRAARRWSLHTKLTVLGTAGLLVFGATALTASEWGNDRTIGSLSPPGALLAGFFAGVMPRTAGFNSLDYAQMDPESLLLTDMLMFVGSGSGGTGGGIKVATMAVLVLMAWGELRGHADVTAFGRRIPQAVQRQALSVAALGIVAVVVGALALMVLSPFGIEPALFEAISAFATVGLSTGITPALSGLAQGVVIVLMFLGRLGPLTLGVALVLHERPLLYRRPSERPLIG